MATIELGYIFLSRLLIKSQERSEQSRVVCFFRVNERSEDSYKDRA